MIQDLLQWAGLLNLNAAVEARSASSFIFALYLVTFKRSHFFFAAFLVSELLGLGNFFGALDGVSPQTYGAAFFLCYTAIWSVTIKSQVNHTENTALAFWCSIMILFCLFMAWDSYYNADIETFAYTHYASIIMLIHGGIILSLYDIRGIFIGVARKLCNFVSNLRSTYFA